MTKLRIRPFRHPQDATIMLWGVQKDKGRQAPMRFIFITPKLPNAMQWASSVGQRRKGPETYVKPRPVLSQFRGVH